MCKFCDLGMVVEGVRLLEKRGGQSDFHDTFERPIRAVVLVVNNAIATGKEPGSGGRAMQEQLESLGAPRPNASRRSSSAAAYSQFTTSVRMP